MRWDEITKGVVTARDEVSRLSPGASDIKKQGVVKEPAKDTDSDGPWTWREMSRVL